MRVTVLAGGISNEREVSLVSGRAVAEGLREAGHEVTLADVGPEDLAALKEPGDVVFPALHGVFGEDGQIQRLMEARGIAFVGSDSAASALAMDKHATKEVWRRAGLPTPMAEMCTISSSLAPPVVVKPLLGGSSLGISICRTTAERDAALTGEPMLVEQFVRGPEWTVGILDGVPLPPIRIATGEGWFDYESKYSETGAAHCFDLGPFADRAERVQALCLRAHDLLGCRHLSRVDLMMDEAGEPWLLELNTMPGFTPRSLLPDAARRAGIGFSTLVDRLVKLAHSETDG